MLQDAGIEISIHFVLNLNKYCDTWSIKILCSTWFFKIQYVCLLLPVQMLLTLLCCSSYMLFLS